MMIDSFPLNCMFFLTTFLLLFQIIQSFPFQWRKVIQGHDTLHNTDTDYNSVIDTCESYPSSRRSYCSVRVREGDEKNYLFIFGGYGLKETGMGNGILGDLWEYNVYTQKYRWIDVGVSPPSRDNMAFEGNLQTTYAYGVFPAARDDCSMVWDKQENTIYMFGGYAASMHLKTQKIVGDLWQFRINYDEWRYVDVQMGGPPYDPHRGAQFNGAYAAEKVFNTGNYPGTRTNAAFVQNEGDGTLILWGGRGLGKSGGDTNFGDLGDLWINQGASNIDRIWMYVNTNSSVQEEVDLQSSYGYKFSKEYYPGGRNDFSFFSYKGSLFIFGGSENGKQKGDLWELNVKNFEWRCLNSNPVQEGGDFNPSYGEGFSSDNYPGSRSGSSLITYRDSVFLFGGFGYWGPETNGHLSDIWQFNFKYEQWRWINTITGYDETQKQFNIHSYEGVYFSNDNYPGSRENVKSFVEGSSLFILGGRGYLSSGGLKEKIHELWELQVHPLSEVYTCNDIPFILPTVCSGHGTCTSADTCTCSEGYIGDDCEYTICHGKRSDDEFSCSQVGICGLPDQCECVHLNSNCSDYVIDAVETPTHYTFRWKNTMTTGESKFQKINPVYSESFSASSYPGSRIDSTLFKHEDSLYLFGGERNGIYKADLWEFSPILNQWKYIDVTGDDITQTPSVSGEYNAGTVYPGGRISFKSVYQESTLIYLFGGNGVDGSMMNGVLGDLWSYNPISQGWDFINTAGDSSQQSISVSGAYLEYFNTTSRIGARKGYVSFQYGNSFYIFGGEGVTNTPANYGILGDLWEFNTLFLSWRFINTIGDDTQKTRGFQGQYFESFSTKCYPGARAYASSYQYGESFFIFGGHSQINSFGDIFEYHIPSKRWRYISTISDSKIQSRLIVDGVDYNSEDGEVYPSSRSRSSHWGYGDLFYVWGGENFFATVMHNDLWAYSITEKKWKFIRSNSKLNGTYGEAYDESHYPGSRIDAPSVRYKNSVFIFGGKGYDESSIEGEMLIDIDDLGDLWELSIPHYNLLPTRCFGIDYNDFSRVCSGKGSCVLNDHCLCNEGYIGGKCEYFEKFEPTVHHTFVVYETGDCQKEIWRECLKGGMETLNVINQKITEEPILLNSSYFFELVTSVHYETKLKFNYWVDKNIIIYSDELGLNTTGFSFCHLFNTTSKFEIKVYQGCYKGGVTDTLGTLFSVDFISYTLLYIIAVVCIVCLSLLFLFVLLFQVWAKSYCSKKQWYQKRVMQPEPEPESSSGDRQNTSKPSFLTKISTFLKCIAFLFVLKLKDLFALAFSLTNFVKAPESDVDYGFLKDTSQYNAIIISLLVVVLIYITVDLIVLIGFIKLRFSNILRFTISYGTYKEWLVSKYILLFPYGIFVIIGVRFLVIDLWNIFYVSKNFMLIFGSPLSMFFSVLLLFITIMSTFNYNGSSSYSLHKLINEKKNLDLPDINISWTVVLFDPDKVLQSVITCLNAVYDMKYAENCKDSYQTMIEKIKFRSVYSHLKWVYLSKLSEDDIDRLVNFFFLSKDVKRSENFKEFILYQPVIRGSYIKTFFCGFMSRRFVDDDKEKKLVPEGEKIDSELELTEEDSTKIPLVVNEEKKEDEGLKGEEEK